METYLLRVRINPGENGWGLDYEHEVLQHRACRQFKRLLLGDACVEAARLAELAPLGWWGGANITWLKLAGDAIRIEIQYSFSRQGAIAGAVPTYFLAGCKDHVVELFFNRAFQFALWCASD